MLYIFKYLGSFYSQTVGKGLLTQILSVEHAAARDVSWDLIIVVMKNLPCSLHIYCVS